MRCCRVCAAPACGTLKWRSPIAQTLNAERFCVSRSRIWVADWLSLVNLVKPESRNCGIPSTALASKISKGLLLKGKGLFFLPGISARGNSAVSVLPFLDIPVHSSCGVLTIRLLNDWLTEQGPDSGIVRWIKGQVSESFTGRCARTKLWEFWLM